MSITPPRSASPTLQLLSLPSQSPFRDPFISRSRPSSTQTADSSGKAPSSGISPTFPSPDTEAVLGTAGCIDLESQETGLDESENMVKVESPDLGRGGRAIRMESSDAGQSETGVPSRVEDITAVNTSTWSPAQHHPSLSNTAASTTPSNTPPSRDHIHPPIPVLADPAHPAPEESFMRWSKTASSIFSDAPSSHFYFNKRSTGQFTDFGGSPERNVRPTRIPEAEEEEVARGSGKRTSNGTFGNRPRRWSAVGSSSTGPSREDPFVDDTPPVPVDEPSELQVDDTGSIRPKLRRPLSMSSASDSTFSAPTMHHRAAKPNENGYFPSPTHRRPSHKSPESAQAIDAHLLKSSSKNEHKIIPRGKPLAPPSIGTPLKGGVKEEHQPGDSSESEKGVKHRRAGSKLDQLLGEGAETARVRMQLEKRAMETVLEMPPPGGPKPPARQYKHSPSMSTDSAFSPPSTPQRTGRGPAHRRSASYDSLPSLHPSLSDSITTLSQLLPNANPSPTALPAPTRPSIQPITAPRPRLPVAMDDRAVLLRRARKLESILGEPLPEAELEKHVIEPMHASTTVTTKITNEWPSTPKHDKPEWDREDVVPRTVREMPGSLTKGNKKLAERARAALGLGTKEGEKDLRVYVEREIRVSETTTKGQIDRPGLNRAPHSSPSTPTVNDSPAHSQDTPLDLNEEGLRTRRQQLAKLHRLLGVPVPPSLVMSRPAHNSLRADQPGATHRGSEKESLSFISFDDGQSPPNKWANKLKQTFSHEKKASKADSFMDLRDPRASEYNSSRTSLSPALAGQAMTEKEKAAARRRAAKLEQMFGDAPPQDLYIASTRSSNESSKSTAKIDAFDSYERSLQGLLHLVEHDRSQLIDIVDSLEENQPAPGLSAKAVNRHRNADSPSPGMSRYASHDMVRATSDGMMDPNSHAARRYRAGKLSQFFGETGIDFQNPPMLAPAASNKAKRRETLEGVLGEMWRSVQRDAQWGGIGELELRKLGDLISVLKRRSGGVWEEIDEGKS